MNFGFASLVPNQSISYPIYPGLDLIIRPKVFVSSNMNPQIPETHIFHSDLPYICPLSFLSLVGLSLDLSSLFLLSIMFLGLSIILNFTPLTRFVLSLLPCCHHHNMPQYVGYYLVLSLSSLLYHDVSIAVILDTVITVTPYPPDLLLKQCLYSSSCVLWRPSYQVCRSLWGGHLWLTEILPQAFLRLSNQFVW